MSGRTTRNAKVLARVLAAVGVVGVGVTLALVFTREGQRPAEAVGDLPTTTNTKPNVMLLYDTSANQNENLGTATKANEWLGGYKGPVKRYMTFQAVLTGQFNEGSTIRSLTDPSGLMDRYRDELRFGFVGLDQKAGVTDSDADGWSYGDTFVATHSYTWTSGGMTSKASTGGLVNQGMTSRNATDYPLLPLFRTTDMRADNDRIQSELMKTKFGANRDGLMDMFRDAWWYWTNDFKAKNPNACGDRYNIYLMGGEAGQSYADAVEWVNRMKNDGVVTYVVALVDVNQPLSKQDEIISYANALAQVGGGKCASDEDVYGPSYGTCAFVARAGSCPAGTPPEKCDLAGVGNLSSALGSVMAIILNQVTSRTQLATANAPLLATADGQWRVSAFFQIMQAGGPWRGFLRAIQLDEAGRTKAEIKFEENLNERSYSTRRLLTTNASGALASLSSVLTSEYTTMVSTQATSLAGAGKQCLADAFYASADRFAKMVSGASTSDLPLPASCLSAPAERALVETFQGHKLGDIYHSSPILVGPPELYLNEPSYQQFLIDKKDRPTMIYVGANDGMLHAFYLRHGDATKVGQEAWAFMPRPTIEKLPSRVTGPAILVDATAIARDVQRPRTSPAAQPWRTVLVAGTGRGGPHYFALDVTDPEDPQFLWDFSDPLLGKTITTPAIGRVFVDGVERPVAFLQGGWDPAGVLDGKAFYVVDLFTGALLKRFSNSDTGSVDTVLDAAFSGAPTAYQDLPTTFTTRVFVGDIRGRMWRIDVSSPRIADWKMERFFPRVGDTTYDTATYEKPIFLAPAVALDYARRPIVYYGTGNLEHLDVVEPNYFWAVREKYTLTGGSSTPRPVGELVRDDAPGYPRAMADNEKITGEAVVFNGAVLFTTFLTSGSTCDFGEGRLYALDYLTGKNRLTNTGKLTFAGDTSALPFLALGPGVPSAPLVRQLPSQITYTPTGEAQVSGGQFSALIQTGAVKKTDEITNTTLSVDLGSVSRRADIVWVVEIE